MKVLTLNATEQNGTISVSGTTETDVLAVAISIYNESGDTRLKLETTAVIDGEYSHDITITEGTYKICVADYDGGECATAVVAPAAEESEDDSESAAGTPETGYHTIEKVDESAVTTASSSSAIYISLAAGIIISAILVFSARRAWIRRKNS
ncbi:hypothetical protein IJI69_04010 [Candidatus Saccharibacteria bacterium]|nr:hypothetical protein [Candidatus Saccharibacteria bacterium]